MERTSLVLDHSINGIINLFIENIILNPEVVINNNNTQIIRIDSNSDNNDAEISLIDTLDFPSVIQSGTKLAVGLNDWVLVPFHFRRKEKQKKEFKDLIKARVEN